MDNLDEAYNSFINDLYREAEITGVLKADAFFQLYSRAAIENGDIEHIEHCPLRSEAAGGFALDGYSFNQEQGELILAVCDYRQQEDLCNLNAKEIESFFKKVDRLVENSKDSSFINSIEDSSPTFEIAITIFKNIQLIKRIRIVLFSNARVAIRKKLVTMKELSNIRYSYNILDFDRYIAIQNSKTSSDPIEIDFTENGLTPLPCLNASAKSDDHASYLVVVPGKVLAEVYGLYGARLLEANVRTFLQAKTKVNRGIIKTIIDDAKNFFAFNNGLTATASKIETTNEGGVLQILSINNLQIVNGGQTTASILYSRDKENADLTDVYVQMKLSVVKDESVETLIPKISRYANSQNSINEADFFSSHPYHLQLEKLSRRIIAPPQEGVIAGSQWFYERARGQYKDEQAYLTKGHKDKFLAKFPKEQMLTKTDLSKYEMSFFCKPHIVSKGAQKCFMEFANHINKQWNPEASDFGEGYFKEAMMRALIFRWTDKMVGKSNWYQDDRGYKAQTVTYTIALLSHCLNKASLCIDYRRLWSKQALPESLQQIIEKFAPEVAKIIRDTPPLIFNIGEYCKNEMCWNKVKETLSIDVSSRLKDITISFNDRRDQIRENKSEQKIDSGIDIQSKVLELGPKWKEIKAYAEKECHLTPTEASILDIASQIPNKLPSEKQSKICFEVLNRVIDEGYELT